jgi:hypothetical protein
VYLAESNNKVRTGGDGKEYIRLRQDERRRGRATAAHKLGLDWSPGCNNGDVQAKSQVQMAGALPAHRDSGRARNLFE